VGGGGLWEGGGGGAEKNKKIPHLREKNSGLRRGKEIREDS